MIVEGAFHWRSTQLVEQDHWQVEDQLGGELTVHREVIADPGTKANHHKIAKRMDLQIYEAYLGVNENLKVK